MKSFLKKAIQFAKENLGRIIFLMLVALSILPYARVSYDYSAMSNGDEWILNVLKQIICLGYSFAISLLVPEKFKSLRFLVMLVISFILDNVIQFTFSMTETVAVFGLQIPIHILVLISIFVAIIYYIGFEIQRMIILKFKSLENNKINRRRYMIFAWTSISINTLIYLVILAIAVIGFVNVLWTSI